MRKQVLWRKIRRIIMSLAERLNVDPERALDIFYESRVAEMLHSPEYGLYLMSDEYIIEELMKELKSADGAMRR